jgi:flavodoxin
VTRKYVLIIYYSYSGQTRKLIQSFASGFEECSAEVHLAQIKPQQKIQFPLSSIYAALKMMVETFFRKRIAIEPFECDNVNQYDLIVLAGPTWSYNVSGPMLSFFDQYGNLLVGKRVLPFISCRGYWRTHYWQLKHLLRKCGARDLKPLIFLHPGAEPWRTIGVFLKLAGKMPESGKFWLSRYYRKYGHHKNQIDYAGDLGTRTASALQDGKLEQLPMEVVVKDVKI